MTKVEPPLCGCTKSPFLVGQNSHGEWVVLDQSGLRGGLFVNRAEALRYAMFENGRRPQAVIMVPGQLELDLTSRTPAVGKASPEARVSLGRRAA